MEKQILFVDDEWQRYLRTVKDVLKEDDRFYITVVDNGDEAIKTIKENSQIDIVLLDLTFHKGGLQGKEILTKIKEIEPTLPVIVFTIKEDLHTAVECTKLGAFDYFGKTTSDIKKLKVAVKNALRQQSLEKEIRHLKGSMSSLIGKQPYIYTVPREIEALSEDDPTKTIGLTEYYSFFAVRLVSIASAETNGLLDAQIRFISCLANPFGNRAFDLRYIIFPNPSNSKKGEVHVVLLCRISHQDSDVSTNLAQDLWLDIHTLFRSNLPSYHFSPVEREDEFKKYFQPFPFNKIVEILRVEKEVALKSEKVCVVQPFHWNDHSMFRVIEILLQQRYPCMVSVCLKPIELFRSEKEELDEMLKSFEEELTGYAPGAERNGHKRSSLMRILDGCYTAWQQLRQIDIPYIVKIQIASSHQIRQSLINVIGTEITDAVTSFTSESPYGENEVIATDNLRFLEFKLWNTSLLPPNLYRLRNLVDAREANCAFRLPAPQGGGSVGFGVQITKTYPAPPNLPVDGTLLGINIHHGEEYPVRIKKEDRRMHTYIIGRTGTGKTTLMEGMILSDIKAGEGVCVIDPHGDLIEAILQKAPEDRADDMILFDPADTERPMGLNLLEHKSPVEKDFVVQETVSIFYRLFDPKGAHGYIGPMFEQWLRMGVLTLMEDPDGSSLIQISPIVYGQRFSKV